MRLSTFSGEMSDIVRAVEQIDFLLFNVHAEG